MIFGTVEIVNLCSHGAQNILAPQLQLMVVDVFDLATRLKDATGYARIEKRSYSGSS